MKIDVRSISINLFEFKITIDNTTIKSGTLNITEAGVMADVFMDAYNELIDRINNALRSASTMKFEEE